MFHFKQFSISQNQSGLKVCSESCAFGASINHLNPKRALDIGTGTGILALFFSQRNKNTIIDAIDINSEALKEAEINFKNSPFKNNILSHQISFQDFNTENKYDIIFSNPPFFENHLKSVIKSKNFAKHTDSLPLEILINKSSSLLEPAGSLWLLLPPEQMIKAEEIGIKLNLFPKTKIILRNSPSSNVLREIVEFRFFDKNEMETKEISFRKQGNKEYHESFIELTKDYYQIF